ncbi:MAG: glucosaminidase domain-containing protein, partial [Spirochaetaceae bacterium]|nr:glucosaminidase domain-containing protein [Spirochaetaceae bacterium]
SSAQPEDLPVMGDEHTTFERFYSHATSKNYDLDEYYARRLFESYETECAAEGVSPVVALSQMIHETDYLLFTGAVRATQYNYAGLGSTSEGTPGLNFGTMDRGVRAHVQHLKAYGSEDSLVGELLDPRFRYVARGSAPTIMALAGKWAVDPEYGRKILAHAHRLIVSAGLP